MTQDEIIEMAREAGISYNPGSQHDHDHFRAYGDSLKAYTKLVAAKERKNAWEAVNALIVHGDIGGNGTDPSAQRNGIVLATNVLADRICRGQA